MRAGETDKSRSFKDNKLFSLIISLVEKIGYEYMIDIDIFKIGDEYYFLKLILDLEEDIHTHMRLE